MNISRYKLVCFWRDLGGERESFETIINVNIANNNIPVKYSSEKTWEGFAMMDLAVCIGETERVCYKQR